MWNGSQVQRKSNKSTGECKEMILEAADLRLKTTGTILKKSSLLHGENRVTLCPLETQYRVLS